MADRSRLRPLERRVLRLTEDGVGDIEIAWRLRRSPRSIRQVAALARMPRDGGHVPPAGLRPLERRVLWWRDRGAGFDEMAARFRRSPRFLRQVEKLAHYKQAKT